MYFCTKIPLMFAQILIDWYLVHKRDLPWRNTTNPYEIWLSEIILQQTRVDQGLSYYHKFTSTFPTVQDLASASEQEVLNLWQGLGYYSRARNLHATAKYIADDLNGVFPTSYNEFIQLKGVGPYTAAAIASFAFKEAKALVDGNVYRVLARYFDMELPIDSTLGKKQFQQLADELIDVSKPDVYNQAIMEFGSQQCTPVAPNCERCVLNASCLSLKNGTVSLRPVKEKKTKVRERFFYFGVFQKEGKICIVKREGRDIWQNMYQFPLVETTARLDEMQIENQFLEHFQLKPNHISKEVKHILSHQKIFARFVHFSQFPAVSDFVVIKLEELQNFPLPRLIDRYLEENDLISSGIN